MTTINFTEKELNRIASQANVFTQEANAELSTLDNLTELIQKYRPDMKASDAVETAGKIIAGVTDFDKAFARLREEQPDSAAMQDMLWENFQEKLDQLSPAEQAKSMTLMIALLKQIDAANVAAVLKGKSEIAGDKFEIADISDKDATPELIAELSTRLREAMETSTVMITGTAEAEAVFQAVSDDDTTGLAELAGKHVELCDFKAYCSLAAWLQIENGEFEGIESGIDPQVIALGVSAGIERQIAIEQAQAGLISWETAHTIINWSGGAMLLGLFIWLNINIIMAMMGLSAVVVATLLGSSLLGLLMGLLIGGYVGYKCQDWLLDNVEMPIMDALSEFYDTAAEAIAAGYETVKEFMRPGIEAVKKAAIACWNWLKELWDKLVASVKNNVHDPEVIHETYSEPETVKA